MRGLANFCAGFLCALVVMVAVPVVAQTGSLGYVSALHGAVSVVVNHVDAGIDTLLFNDRTYVPLRFMAENFGASVDFDPQTRSVLISTTEYNLAYFEHFPRVPTFESVTGVSNINIFEHDTNRLRFSISRNYSSDYEFLQYVSALKSAGFVGELDQGTNRNGIDTIVLEGNDARVVASMLETSYTFSVIRT